MAKHPLKRRLAARKSIAMLTGSHASLGLANRMTDFKGLQTAGRMPTYGDYLRMERDRTK